MDEIENEVKRPVVKALCNLLRFRNTSEAFDLEGSIEIETPSSNEIVIIRKNKTNKIAATLKANLSTKTFQISENERNILI